MHFILKKIYQLNDFLNPKHLIRNLNIYKESKTRIGNFDLQDIQHRLNKKKRKFL